MPSSTLDPRGRGRTSAVYPSVLPRNSQPVTPPVSLDEALPTARLLSVRLSWIQDATRAGQLPVIRVGRHLRYTRSKLEAWLNEPSRTAR
jgi:excisionase family DNA binding protein